MCTFVEEKKDANKKQSLVLECIGHKQYFCTKITSMKKRLILLTTALLMSGCGYQSKEKQTYLLQGAWVLRHAEYPAGAEDYYSLEGSGTFCLIYDGDSVLYECRIASTPSGLLMIPIARCSVTLIDKGGGELLYLEDEDPHPLTLSDSIITIQRNGVLLSWARADHIYKEWGSEICEMISREIDDDKVTGENRYVLSTTERQQERTIHWFSFFSAFIVLVASIAAHMAIINRRDKKRLQLQLQQISEVHENRPEAVRQVVASVEATFFASNEYATLKKRMANGQLLKEQDWLSVEQNLKTVYPGFISQLTSLYPLSELEYQTCLLIKLRIAPKDIAGVLARDMSTISTVRSRLYKKVFGRKGGAKDWDDFILSVGT